MFNSNRISLTIKVHRSFIVATNRSGLGYPCQLQLFALKHAMRNSSMDKTIPTQSVETVIIASLVSGTGLTVLIIVNLFVCGIVLALHRWRKAGTFRFAAAEQTLARESQSKDEYPETPLCTTVMSIDIAAAQMRPQRTQSGPHPPNLEPYISSSIENVYASIHEPHEQNQSRQAGTRVESRPYRVPPPVRTSHNPRLVTQGNGPRRAGSDLTLTQSLEDSLVLI